MKCDNCRYTKMCVRRLHPMGDTFNCEHYEEYEQRPHGTWVDVPKYKGFYVCSKCLERLNGDFERFDHWEMKKDNFCSVCGSDNRHKEDKGKQIIAFDTVYTQDADKQAWKGRDNK